MYNAKIINNKPICGKCGSDNISGIRDYKEVEMDNKSYTMFQIKCYNCNADNKYLADVYLSHTKRYEINHKINDVKGGEGDI